MRSLKTVALAATTALALAFAGATAANAQHGFRGGGFHGGWHGGSFHGRGFGPAVGAGLAFGALATAPYWGGYGYDCGPGVVTYDAYGNAVVTDGCY